MLTIQQGFAGNKSSSAVDVKEICLDSALWWRCQIFDYYTQENAVTWTYSSMYLIAVP